MPKIAAVQTSASTEFGRGRSHGDAEFRSHPGRTAFGRARASAPARPRGACARPGRRNWSPISTSTSAIRRSARRRAAEITVSFALDRMGHVLSTSIVKGSGDTRVRRGRARHGAALRPGAAAAAAGRRRRAEFHPAGDLPGQGQELTLRRCVAA